MDYTNINDINHINSLRHVGYDNINRKDNMFFLKRI